jgi:uncharacterized protein (TIGR02996 family)
MTAEAGLLATIWDEPHDDVPRLVYADWLEEHGGEEELARANLIRAQCELAHLPGDDPRYDILESREADILARWERGWWKRMPAGCRKGRFRRGFPVPDLGRFSLSGLVRLNEKRLKLAPLWRYHYGVHGANLDILLSWPFLHRLELFALRSPLPAGWSERMAACPNLRNVSDLALIDCDLDAAAMQTLLDAWTARPLMAFQANLTSANLQILANHPAAARLRRLDGGGRQLDSNTLCPLATGRSPVNLICSRGLLSVSCAGCLFSVQS